MTTIEVTQLKKHIQNVLSSKRFADWYGDNGRFGGHIMGDEGAPNEAEILTDIESMFVQPVIDATSRPVARVA